MLEQVRHLLWLVGALVLGAAAWWVRSGDPSLLVAAGWLALVVLGGLVGSFTTHEMGHLLALRRVASVQEVLLERTAWRTSLLPVGSLSPRAALVVAVAGPGACVAVGLVLWAAQVPAGLQWWYLAHAAALLPPFGDGRAALAALRTDDRPA